MYWLQGLSNTLSSTLKVPPFTFNVGLALSYKSRPALDSRCKNRFTLSYEMDITSPNRQQLACLGSLNKNHMYIGKVHRDVEGRVISLIKAWPSGGYGSFNLHSLHCLSMRNFYLYFSSPV
jgi:nuclear transport factor 2 (NTF2) superfamily protein